MLVIGNEPYSTFIEATSSALSEENRHVCSFQSEQSYCAWLGDMVWSDTMCFCSPWLLRQTHAWVQLQNHRQRWLMVQLAMVHAEGHGLHSVLSAGAIRVLGTSWRVTSLPKLPLLVFPGSALACYCMCFSFQMKGALPRAT